MVSVVVEWTRRQRKDISILEHSEVTDRLGRKWIARSVLPLLLHFTSHHGVHTTVDSSQGTIDSSPRNIGPMHVAPMLDQWETHIGPLSGAMRLSLTNVVAYMAPCGTYAVPMWCAARHFWVCRTSFISGYMAHLWHPCATHVAPMWHPCGTYPAPIWHPSGPNMAPMRHPCGTYMWHPCDTHVASMWDPPVSPTNSHPAPIYVSTATALNSLVGREFCKQIQSVLRLVNQQIFSLEVSCIIIYDDINKYRKLLRTVNKFWKSKFYYYIQFSLILCYFYYN